MNFRRAVLVFATMMTTLACVPAGETDETDNGAADSLARQRAVFRGLGLRHGAFAAPDAGDAAIMPVWDGGGTFDAGPPAPPPTQIVVDFVDLTGEDINEAGDTPMIARLRGVGRPPSTDSLAETLLEEMNARLQGPAPGLMPQLLLGTLRVEAPPLTNPNGWDQFATRGHFTFILLNDSQVLADGSTGACGYQSWSVTRAVMIVVSCMRSLLQENWTSSETPYYLRILSEVLTHEFGHWLGLSHTFGPWNSDAHIPQDCVDRDQVSDTPPHNETGLNNNSCDALPANSCAGYEHLQHPFLNVMSYAECPRTFTRGQVELMKTNWTYGYTWRGFGQP